MGLDSTEATAKLQMDMPLLTAKPQKSPNKIPKHVQQSNGNA